MPLEQAEQAKYLVADKARFDRALAAFRSSGVVDVVRQAARGMKAVEVVVSDTYEPPVGIDPGIVNPIVCLVGPELARNVGTGGEFKKGWVRQTVVVRGEDDGKLTMHRWTDSWTREDKKDFGGSRSAEIPFDPRNPGTLQRAIKGDKVFPRW